MTRLSGPCFGLALLATVAIASAQAPQPVPPLRAHVTDLTGTLSAAERDALERRLADFEAKRGSQIAVLIVATTRPEEIEPYAIRVVEAWQLGREKFDDGALLLVAKDDRRLRIEVGDGLEGVLTDLVAKRIVSDVIAPRFRAGDFAGGVEAGVDVILKVVEGEALPPPERHWTAPRDVDPGALLPLALFGAIVIAPILRRILGRGLGALAAGGLAGVVVWLVTGLLAFALAAALIGFLFTLLGVGGRGWSSHGRRAGWGGGLGGRGGGGFRGGGGRFSGGGASGSW
jgi:uncharacterized protein